MESGSGLECFRPASPRLQRALDEYGTSLSDSSVKIAESIGPFSCNDTWTMTPDMFTSVSGGVQVIALAKTVVNATRSVPFAPGRVPGHVNGFSEVVVEHIFNERLPKLKPYELGEFSSSSSGGPSGQAEARN